jgi:hypothetical protein
VYQEVKHLIGVGLSAVDAWYRGFLHRWGKLFHYYHPEASGLHPKGQRLLYNFKR